jgi:hypothetical protein
MPLRIHGGDHGGIGEESLWRHIGQHPALLQGDDAVRVAFDEIHIVLDLDDAAHAGRFRRRDQDFHDRVLVAGRNAAGRLVQQDNGGIERKCAGDIEQFLLTL